MSLDNKTEHFVLYHVGIMGRKDRKGRRTLLKLHGTRVQTLESHNTSLLYSLKWRGKGCGRRLYEFYKCNAWCEC